MFVGSREIISPSIRLFAHSQVSLAQSTLVDAFITKESPVARAGLLANIGPSGAKSSGAKVWFKVSNKIKKAGAHLFD